MDIFRASLNVIVTMLFSDTLVALQFGLTLMMVGGVVSGTVPVVNEQTRLDCNATPDELCTPVVIVNV